MADKSGQEIQGGEAAVGNQHQVASRQPPAYLQDYLPAPLGQLFVPPAVLAVVSFGGGQRGQKRKSPDALRPGDRHQQHHAEPAQAGCLDEMPVAGADRVAIDAFGGDALATATLDRVVEAEHHGTVRRESPRSAAATIAGRPEAGSRPLGSAPGGSSRSAAHASARRSAARWPLCASPEREWRPSAAPRHGASSDGKTAAQTAG